MAICQTSYRPIPVAKALDAACGGTQQTHRNRPGTLGYMDYVNNHIVLSVDICLYRNICHIVGHICYSSIAHTLYYDLLTACVEMCSFKKVLKFLFLTNMKIYIFLSYVLRILAVQVIANAIANIICVSYIVICLKSLLKLFKIYNVLYIVERLPVI